MNVKTYLISRIALIALLCLAYAAAWVFWAVDRDRSEEGGRILDFVARQLEVQLTSIGTPATGKPYVAQLAPIVEERLPSGYCVRYTAADAGVSQSICKGWDASIAVPEWFASMFLALAGGERDRLRPLNWRGRSFGSLVVSVDPARHAAQAWHDVATLVGFAAVIVIVTCAFVYAVVGRALSPARDVVQGFSRLESGDLSARLPRFELAELQTIGTGFNRMAEALGQAVSERAALTARLVDLEQEGRRRLARELHDELGQCLAAANAIASGMVHSAEVHCPELAEDSARLGAICSRMSDLVRGMLRRLRPLGQEQLGLPEALKSLVGEWRATRLPVELEIVGKFERMPEDLVLGVYRLVQECLTNASKHARATRIDVRVRLSAGKQARLDVYVEDDGVAGVGGRRITPGLGLLGMRERVTALGGTLELGEKAAGGLVVSASFPLSDTV